MLAGEPYDPLDPKLFAGRRRAQEMVIAFNGELAAGNPCQVIREL